MGATVAAGPAAAATAQPAVQVRLTTVPTGYSATSLVCPSAHECLVTLTTSNLRVAAGVSSNGGTSWRIVRLPAELLGLSSLSCADALHCVAAGTTATPGTIRQSPVFVTTADGGTSWLVRPIPSAFGITGLYSIACTSATSCLAVAIDLRQVTHLLVSSDGGAIWTLRSSPLKDLRGIACRTGGRCVLYAGGYADSGPESEEVVSSGDGGAHWGGVASFKGVETIQAASCPSATACVLVGGTISQAEPNSGNGVVLRTSDGGSKSESRSGSLEHGDARPGGLRRRLALRARRLHPRRTARRAEAARVLRCRSALVGAVDAGLGRRLGARMPERPILRRGRAVGAARPSCADPPRARPGAGSAETYITTLIGVLVACAPGRAASLTSC